MPSLPPQPGHDGGPTPAGGAATGAISFEVLAEIAAGATSRVDLCRLLPPHPRAGALVAVKRLHPHIADDPTFVKQFLDEVRFTHWLRHPNVVEVAGWGTDPEGSYLAVELVQGVSLLRLMKTIFDTGEAFTERTVVYIAACICRGLGAAHSLRAPDGEMLNLVHRDLTPGNVLLGFHGEVKIADFGMAKAKQRLTKTLTGMRKGEPTYMAPEQARSDDFDARADLFSLGVILFELFAGRRPWVAKSDFDMVQIISRDPPADLRELRPKIDRELVNVVNRCLERDPAARHQSAHEIAARLDEWLTLHGYQEENDEALGRFVRRNAMRQMRWFERAIAGEMAKDKAGRELHPRVPTYTEHTKPPPSREDTPPEPAARVPPRAPSPSRPLVPPRPGGAAADPRSLRAASAVQQLKKLAPPVEPPRARGQRTRTLEEDAEATDVELRLDRTPSQGVRLHGEEEEDDDESGEEAPTLVKKGDAKLQALRAEARAKHAKPFHDGAASGPMPRAPAGPPYAPPGVVADEESDQRITEVRQEERRRAAAQALKLANITDPESDLPTSPQMEARPRPPPPPDDEAPTPSMPREAKTTAVNVGPPVGPPRRSRPRAEGSSAPPPFRQIPPSPDVPPRPFPSGPGRAKPLEADRPSRPTARPSHDEFPPLAHEGVPASGPTPQRVSGAADPGRTTHDDVEVLDRSALQQGSPMTEETIVAEADRLAIEALRHREEARSAQLRAERKAAAAKLAAEAAAIAADAVRMMRASGLAAAAMRLEEARALDQNLQSGRIPQAEVTAALQAGVSTFPGPLPAPTPATPAPAPPAYTEAPSLPPPEALPASTPIFAGAAANGAAPHRHGSIPPAPLPREAPLASGARAAPIFAGTAPPAGPPLDLRSLQPPLPGPVSAPPFHGGPASVRPPAEHFHGGAASVPPPRPLAEPMPPAFGAPVREARALAPLPEGGNDADAFRSRIRPSLLGTPGGALIALVAIGVLVALALIVALGR